MVVRRDDDDRSLMQARSILRDHGLRCTTTRLAVMSVLFDPGVGHLNAHEIVTLLGDHGDPVDLTTVYRTLATLVDVGVLHALTVHDRTTTYGLTANPHHHAVCTKCGAVIEVPAEQLSTALTHASDGSRFALSPTAGLTLHGLCPDCQAAGS